MNTVDPILYAKRLAEAGVPAAQAHIHADIIAQLIAATNLTRLENKVDVGLDSLNTKIDRGNAELEAKIEQVRTNLEVKIEQVRTDLEAKIEQVKTDLEAQMIQLRCDLEAKIDGVKWECVRWMFAIGTAQVAAVISAMQWMR